GRGAVGCFCVVFVPPVPAGVFWPAAGVVVAPVVLGAVVAAGLGAAVVRGTLGGLGSGTGGLTLGAPSFGVVGGGVTDPMGGVAAAGGLAAAAGAWASAASAGRGLAFDLLSA